MLYKKSNRFEFLPNEEEGMVVFDSETGTVGVIDPVGQAILEALDLENGSTLDDLVTHLLEEFDAPEDEIRQDTQEFLDQLVEQGILDVCE